MEARPLKQPYSKHHLDDNFAQRYETISQYTSTRSQKDISLGLSDGNLWIWVSAKSGRRKLELLWIRNTRISAGSGTNLHTK